uniref:Uncharacterized protein n=1 Tax=Placozoan sp. BZ2423 TaxID=401705 RepID=A2T441_9METZ|nr:hypothetical protein [Placozoan sp. BZ2423]
MGGPPPPGHNLFDFSKSAGNILFGPIPPGPPPGPITVVVGSSETIRTFSKWLAPTPWMRSIPKPLPGFGSDPVLIYFFHIPFSPSAFGAYKPNDDCCISFFDRIFPLLINWIFLIFALVSSHPRLGPGPRSSY